MIEEKISLIKPLNINLIKSFKNKGLGDFIFKTLLRVSCWSLIILLIILVLLLVNMSRLSFQKFGFDFFLNSEWNSVTEEFGGLAMSYGTVVTSVIALFIGFPLSISMAMFLTEIAPRPIAKILSFFVEMLAAVPSIVYGMWGLFVLIPFLREFIQKPLSNYFGFLPIFSGPPMGVGLMAAGVVLAIMILPTITAITYEVFKSVPQIQREAALGLGATKWEMIKISVLSPSKAGIMAASLLGLGRALGETMAVTMVIGNNPIISASLFSSGQTLASILANQYAEADSELQLSALSGLGLTLLIVSLVINVGARAWVWRFTNQSKNR